MHVNCLAHSLGTWLTFVTLLNYHLLSKAPGYWMVDLSLRKDHKRIEIKSFLQVLEEVHGMPWGPCGWSQGRVQAESRQDLVYMTLLGSVGGGLWSSWAKAELVSSNQRSGILIIFLGTLSKVHARGRPLKMVDTFYHKGPWGSHRNLHLFAALQAALQEGLVSGPGSCRLLGHTEQNQGSNVIEQFSEPLNIYFHCI